MTEPRPDRMCHAKISDHPSHAELLHPVFSFHQPQRSRQLYLIFSMAAGGCENRTAGGYGVMLPSISVNSVAIRRSIILAIMEFSSELQGRSVALKGLES